MEVKEVIRLYESGELILEGSIDFPIGKCNYVFKNVDNQEKYDEYSGIEGILT